MPGRVKYIPNIVMDLDTISNRFHPPVDEYVDVHAGPDILMYWKILDTRSYIANFSQSYTLKCGVDEVPKYEDIVFAMSRAKLAVVPYSFGVVKPTLEQ